MRMWVLFLVLLNLAFFAWMTQRGGVEQPPARAPSPPAMPSYVEPLVLLKERPAQPSPPQAVAGEAAGTPEPVDEAPAPPPPEGAPEGEGVPTAGAAAVPETLCHTLGPFTETAAAEEAKAVLQAQGLDVRLREASTKVPEGYWVYLPEMSAERAQAVVEDLVAKGVTDYFRGPQNFISLGIYRARGMAEERRAEIEALGYAPVVEPRLEERTVFWLDIEERGREHWGEERWQQFLADREGVRLQPLSCE